MHHTIFYIYIYIYYSSIPDKICIRNNKNEKSLFSKMGIPESRSPAPLPETRSPVPFLYRPRPSGGEIRNLAAVSSSLLPAFGTVMGEGSAQLRRFVIAPYDRRYRYVQK